MSLHSSRLRAARAPRPARGLAWPPAARALALACVAALGSGCRAVDPLPKEPALDLDALDGPSPADFSTESALVAGLAGDMTALWDGGDDGELAGVAGVPVRYHRVLAPAERGAVVVLPGRTEAARKYIEVAFDLVGQGYSVYVLDHRGQGASGRMLPDVEAGYVEYFSDYVSDLELLVDTVVEPAGHERLYLLAHSMGGAVAALYLDRHPDAVRAAALSAPMFDIDTGAFPGVIAGSISGSACSVGAGTGYAAGQGPYAEEESVVESEVTHSEARWQAKLDLYRDRPELRLGGATYRWVCESLQAASAVQGLGPYTRTPTLLLQAGADTVVPPGGQDRYCADARRCQVERFEGAFHEVLMETDDIRNVALAHAARFFRHFEEAP